jgi:hypothetical protein
MKQAKSIWVMGVFLAGVVTANATLQISVATDKAVYQLGETVEVYISVYNPTSSAVTMYVPDPYSGQPVARYLMDDTYFWPPDAISPQVFLPPVPMTIQAGGTLTWELEHGTIQNAEYSLIAGVHSVKGFVYADVFIGQYGGPVAFQVVPEPMTISLLAFGFLLLRRKK